MENTGTRTFICKWRWDWWFLCVSCSVLYIALIFCNYQVKCIIRQWFLNGDNVEFCMECGVFITIYSSWIPRCSSECDIQTVSFLDYSSLAFIVGFRVIANFLLLWSTSTCALSLYEFKMKSVSKACMYSSYKICH